MAVRAILFDLDNPLTLEHESTIAAVDASARLASQRAGIDPHALTAAVCDVAAAAWRSGPAQAVAETYGVWWGEALWGDFAGTGSALAALREGASALRHAIWRGALARIPETDDLLAAVGGSADALADALDQTFVAWRRAHERVDHEAETLLRDLSREYRLALVTNGAGDIQREKLSRTPFEPYFSAVVVSLEVGAAKPDPVVFRHALERLGVPAIDAVMVGDSLQRDVAGAHAAGVRSIWIDRGIWSEQGPRPDATISRLGELPAAILAVS